MAASSSEIKRFRDDFLPLSRSYSNSPSVLEAFRLRRRCWAAPERRRQKMNIASRSALFHAMCLLGGCLSVSACAVRENLADDAIPRRLMMTDNSAETGMRDCVKRATEAASKEDLDTFISYFTESQRQSIRRKAAMLFVRHTVSLELTDCHVVDEAGTHATLAIKYKAVLNDDGFDVVSILHLEKENDVWKIRREQVVSHEQIEPARDTTPRQRVACAGGRCRLVADE